MAICSYRYSRCKCFLRLAMIQRKPAHMNFDREQTRGRLEALANGFARDEFVKMYHKVCARCGVTINRYAADSEMIEVILDGHFPKDGDPAAHQVGALE